jgi:hypothetical protein
MWLSSTAVPAEDPGVGPVDHQPTVLGSRGTPSAPEELTVSGATSVSTPRAGMEMWTGATPGDSVGLGRTVGAGAARRTGSNDGGPRNAAGTTPESAMLEGARHGVMVADATGDSARSIAIPVAPPSVAAGHAQERDAGRRASRRRSRTPPATKGRPRRTRAPPVPGQGGAEIGPNPAPTDCGKLDAAAGAAPEEEVVPVELVPMVPLLVV